MGYTVTVDDDFYPEPVVVSENISHGSMRRCLEAFADIAGSLTPQRLTAALLPGQNGARLLRRDCMHEAGHVAMLAALMYEKDHPEAWVADVLATAMLDVANSRDGVLEFA